MSTAQALGLTMVLLAANAFFVGAQFALMAARRSRLEPLARAGGKRAALVLQALDRMAALLVCAQLGITVTALLLGALSARAFERLLAGAVGHTGLADVPMRLLALVPALLVVVALYVVIGEAVPKKVVIAGPERAALLLAPTLLYLTRALAPLIAAMGGLVTLIVRLLRIEPERATASGFTAQEMPSIAPERAREGLLGRHGPASRVIEFGDRVAADVAVPTRDLVTLDQRATPADVERLVAKRGFSRYPVLDAAGDVEGYVHLKDVLYADERERHEPVPAKRVRRLATVGPRDEIEDVLESMQRTGSHLARVVLPDGSVTGVVFLEDVIEELVGEVLDASLRHG